MGTESEVKATERTSLGIRSVLFDELDMLRRGESSPSRANAVAKTASQILSTVKIELEYARFQSGMASKDNQENTLNDAPSPRVLKLG